MWPTPPLRKPPGVPPKFEHTQNDEQIALLKEILAELKWMHRDDPRPK